MCFQPRGLQSSLETGLRDLSQKPLRIGAIGPGLTLGLKLWFVFLLIFLIFGFNLQLGIVVHALNPSLLEPKAAQNYTERL